MNNYEVTTTAEVKIERLAHTQSFAQPIPGEAVFPPLEVTALPTFMEITSLFFLYF